MGRINYEGEYSLQYGTRSIFHKYSQNGRIPSNATIVGGTQSSPSFGYTFDNTIPPSTSINAVSGELLDAVNMWVVPSTQAAALKKYGNIQYWNVSKVTNMKGLFNPKIGSNIRVQNGLKTFNENIGNWDVSNVTNMQKMFYDAIAFNGNISNWNVSKVTSMENMFTNAQVFNGDLDKWNVSNANNLRKMFFGATTFNGNISTWNVSNVTDMRAMFFGANAFNGNISNWDVSNVTDMQQMFYVATVFNGNISIWNVGKVTNMKEMFERAIAFDQRLGSWDVSRVAMMGGMFSGATAFMNNDDNYTSTTNGISKWKPAAITGSNQATKMFMGIANTGVNPVWSNLLTNGLVSTNGNVNTPAATTGTNPRMFNN